MRNLLCLLAAFSAPLAHANNECQLPADQGHGSLFGSWEKLPVTLVLDREFYRADGGRELQALLNGVATWNAWAAFKGKVAFVLAAPSEGAEIPELTSCSASDYTAAFPDAVGIWKINGEGWRRNRRESCGVDPNGVGGRLLPLGLQGKTDWRLAGGRIRGASVLMNFEDYNAPGKQLLDVESLAVHELGHVLGLLHSCNGSSSAHDIVDPTSAPACFDRGEIAVPPAYAQAAMFPFLEQGQPRRSLGTNDLGRVNCLY